MCLHVSRDLQKVCFLDRVIFQETVLFLLELKNTTDELCRYWSMTHIHKHWTWCFMSQETDTHEKTTCIIFEDHICHVTWLLEYKKGPTLYLHFATPPLLPPLLFVTKRSQCKYIIPSQFIKVILSAKLKSYVNSLLDHRLYTVTLCTLHMRLSSNKKADLFQ